MLNSKMIKWMLAMTFLAGCSGAALSRADRAVQPSTAQTGQAEPGSTPAPEGTDNASSAEWPAGPYPLQVEVMREREYSAGPITIEQELDPGSNYSRYRVSYLSEGYKIFALMTVPWGRQPEAGWPVIIFNHGYIHPPDYRTDVNYVSYMGMLARSGYIVFKPDFRGHGSSEGDIVGGGYGSPAYTADVLNAMESLKNYEDADPDRFGMWGHSMGGQVTLRAMVVSDEIRAGVIWAGAIAPYPEIISEWDYTEHQDEASPGDSQENDDPDESARGWWESFGSWVQDITAEYGTPEQNPDFWASISPNTYLDGFSGPVQLHHGTEDDMVPLSWSEDFVRELEDENIPHELYIYEGDGHNISGNFREAMQRTVAFFDRYLKEE